MSDPNPIRFLLRFETLLKAQLPSGKLLSFYEYDMPADNDCGYHALGVSRAEAAQCLADNILQEEIREYLGSEIFALTFSRDRTLFTDKIKNGRYGNELMRLLETWDKMQEILDQETIKIRNKIRNNEIKGLSEVDQKKCQDADPEEWPRNAKALIQSRINDLKAARKELENACQNFFICLEYIKYYIAQPGQWLTCLPCIEGRQQYSSIDAICKIKKNNIRVWEEAEVENVDELKEAEGQDRQPVLTLKHEKIFDPTYPTVDIKYKNQHYSLLSADPNLKRHPVMTASYELLNDLKNLEDGKNQRDKKEQQEARGEQFQFDSIIDDLRLISNLNEDFLKELTNILEAIYIDDFTIDSRVVQTKKLKELQECYQQKLKAFENNKSGVRNRNVVKIEELFKAKSELSLYEDSLRKAYQLFHQILRKKSRREKEIVRRGLQTGFNRAALGLEINPSILLESPKKVFETKRIRFKINGKEYEALQVIVYSEILGKRSLVYQDNIILGQEDVNLPLGDNYNIIVSKEGALKIGKCDEANHLLFKLDDHDIEFYDELHFSGSIDIQSAKACNIIGKVKVVAGFRVKAEKFHLTGKPGEEGELQARCFAAETRSFTNRGIISGLSPDTILSNHLTKINAEIFDNRGGRIFANSAKIRFKEGKNDKGILFIHEDLEFEMESSLSNEQGKIWSESGNIHFYEKAQKDSSSNATLINGDQGEIRAIQGHINCKISEIKNEKGGLFESNTASFSHAASLGTVNHGKIQTAAGCRFYSRFINHGSMNNDAGQLFFDVRDLELFSNPHNGGGVTCGGEILSSPLHTFKFTNDALYAGNCCTLQFLHSQIFAHTMSMPGHINIIIFGGKFSNHSNIQSESGIQVLTPWEWGENYSIENFGGLVATNGNIVLQGKGTLHTADGHGIYASNGSLITNNTNTNLSGRAHGANRVEMIARDVYTSAVSAGQDIVSHASQATFNGFSVAGRDTVVSAQNTINVMGRLESGRNTILTAGNSITTGTGAILKSGDSAELVSNEVYLNSTTEVKRRLEIFGTNAVVISGETFSEEDIYIKTKTFIPKAPIRAGKNVELDVDKILGSEADIAAKKICLKENVEMLYCELEVEDDKMVLRPLGSKMEIPTPEEMEKQQRQIEEFLEQIRQEKENLAKQKKKAKRKMVIKVVLGTVAGIGLSALLGPQMALLFSKLNISGIAATLGTLVGEGMIMSGVNAAVMGNNILKSAVKGGALALLGPLGKELAVHVYETARHRQPSFKTLGINLLSSAVGAAADGLSGAQTQGVRSVKNVVGKNVVKHVAKEIVSKTGEAVAKAGLELGTKVAFDKKLRKSENLGATAVATLVSAGLTPVTQYGASKLSKLVNQGHPQDQAGEIEQKSTQDKKKTAEGRREPKRETQERRNRDNENHNSGKQRLQMSKTIQISDKEASISNPDTEVSNPRKDIIGACYRSEQSQDILSGESSPAKEKSFKPLILSGTKAGSKTRITTDKIGRTRYNDGESGRYSKSPLERALGEKTSKFKMKDPSVKVSSDETPETLDLIQRMTIVSNENCQVTAGVTPYKVIQGKTSVSQSKTQASIQATGTGVAGVNVLDAQIEGRFGQAQVQVDGPSVQLDANFSVDLNPNRRSIDIHATARASRVAVKAVYTTPKIPLPAKDSTLQCTAQTRVAAGLNLDLGFGYSDYKRKQGGSTFARLGLTVPVTANTTVSLSCEKKPLKKVRPNKPTIFDGYTPTPSRLIPPELLPSRLRWEK